MKKLYSPYIPTIIAIFGISSSLYAADTFWRNPDAREANFDDLDAWIYQNTTNYGTPTSADTIRMGSEEGFLTSFTGDVSINTIEAYGGTNTFTDEVSAGGYQASSFIADYRAKFYGGTFNIYSIADVANGEEAYTFTTKDAFIVGDDSSGYVKEDVTLNIYGVAKVKDNHWGFCFGEAAQKFATTVNVYDTADLTGELKIGSKTYAEAAKTTVNFYGNSTATTTKLSMYENGTLNIYGSADVHATNDINIYNGQNDSRKVYLNLSENGKLRGDYKVYQYNADIKLADNSNITVYDYYLGSKTSDGSVSFTDTLEISDNATVKANNYFNAYKNSVVNITGEGANLSAKRIFLDSATINVSASKEDVNNVNGSERIFIYNSGALNVSKGQAYTYSMYLGSNGTDTSKGSLKVSGTGKYTSRYFNAYGNSLITIDGGNFEVTNQGKDNGIAFNGATTMTIQNGATVDLDRFAMYDENAKIELKGSDLNVTAWCIGGDTSQDPNYDNQLGTIAFVADANGISTLVSTYIDYNFDILLDFSKFAIEGESTFNIVTITSGYYSRVENWEIDQSMIEVKTANDQDYYEIKVIDSRNLAIIYNHVNVIPEPSTYAAIFGALALAFVAYRKRK